ncbi:XshC-Cox1 family protein [Pseudomonas daroniae]|uniref:XshC-Cox1 family protein n=1 Tax=Phytopseudomonas daroniae TaxID=2487519 RepID=A0A4Q9QN24_9GAMM|nr:MULTISPECIES: XdhC family protein [Pseudomonas]TBU79342.1 XshC-Cox1 family protein [Pseudomonas daroniae]TBU80124.1 XshC-Cox1 family protein [Pseudomonas sp. FRB 228]TBU91442.1 XshC-Cox1 family protein [Pseudomonas daroniae]
MRHLDLKVLDQALQWARDGHELWLCTVLSTYGSAPRAPGAMLVALGDGSFVGSLSGGCVEEAFLDTLKEGGLRATTQVVRYGESNEDRHRLKLPCGGILQVLVERRSAEHEWIAHLELLQATLLGQRRLCREVDFSSGEIRLREDDQGGERVEVHDEVAYIRIGPALRLILAGLSPVAEYCASFARAVGCEVIACDPREEMQEVVLEGVEMQRVLPSLYIAAGGCHEATAVVALTHDPKIDDLAVMEAVRTPAFYIGAMGSRQTSARRAERLARVGGLGEAQIARIHMPIGLNLGSKSPAEIALAVVADVLRVYHGKSRDEL